MGQMSGEHTQHHNDDFTFVGALSHNHEVEAFVERRNQMLSSRLDAVVPWKAYHRANVPHGKRQSNG
ncbi:hypothetical protein TC41_1475 [Alicyclobacillus acidocaldarius subsp. acidocaldarius Tc-4-1]|uniref:Uncharacterized protein n=1 Tax=Alicyclobacillus acidocaldarius (strain Tc-4-1) TaxID=1048834 RepID=F8IJ88_ALIAT|nr:hypothetical protein TC41_1475 [Alicyclobacillus acidocaldarius subsp. acidocaldarius Tc-4-1]